MRAPLRFFCVEIAKVSEEKFGRRTVLNAVFQVAGLFQESNSGLTQGFP